MSKYTNPAHLDNFKPLCFDRVSICEFIQDEIKGGVWFEFANGKTAEEAKERFYMRYMLRTMDQEIINKAQKFDRLYVCKIEGNHRTTIEHNAKLIALV